MKVSKMEKLVAILLTVCFLILSGCTVIETDNKECDSEAHREMRRLEKESIDRYTDSIIRVTPKDEHVDPQLLV